MHNLGTLSEVHRQGFQSWLSQALASSVCLGNLPNLFPPQFPLSENESDNFYATRLL